MRAAPSRAAEKLLGFLLPPACREEVLGDLCERYSSPLRYFVDALSAVPLVILSRIRRTADPATVLMQAFVLYLAYVSAARYRDPAFLAHQWGLLRPALSAAVCLLVLLLNDAYAALRKPSLAALLQGPAVALGFAFLSQGILELRNPELALPVMTMLYGSAIALPLVTAVRALFPPLFSRPQSAGVPAFWLKESAEPIRIPPAVAWFIKGAAILMVLGLAARAGYPELVVLAVILASVYLAGRGAIKRG